MKYHRQPRKRGRLRFQRVPGIERLEVKTLLSAASETFTRPSLTDLITAAEQGQDTAPEGIDRVLVSLEKQLTDGPLTDLNNSTVGGNGFVQEVQGTEASYEQYLDQVLSAFPNVDEILKLAGQAVVADVVSLNEQSAIGLLSASDLVTEAQTAIDSLTSGPIDSLDTPLSGFAAATETFESDLSALEESLNSTSTGTPLTAAQVSAAVLAESEAFRFDVQAGLQVGHPNIANAVDAAVNNVESTAAAIAGDSSSDTQTALTSAIGSLDAALFGTSGLFGPEGAISEALASQETSTPVLPNAQTASVMSDVSGMATSGGTATLTAALTWSLDATGKAGETIDFTLDGEFAGQAVTDGSGVATLTGVETSDAVGTDVGGVSAVFGGDIQYKPSDGSGDLLVSQIGTALSSVSGTATSGGTATLSATLTAPVTDTAIAGETVSFTLDGTSVGSATTNASGVATLTGVATSDAVGTDTGGVVASFAGDTTYAAAASGTGDLVVSAATTQATTLGSVAGMASSGGTAALTATLTNSATSAGISGETIDFTLDSVSVGSAVTDSAGVATLTGVTTTDGLGTDTGGVAASFAGDTNYSSSSGTGNLVVTQATTVGSVSGTASYGGTATLIATLTDTATSAGISGETVDFTLNGTAVGTATTDSNGVATLTGAATSEAAGTDTGDVVASFAGDTTYSATSGTGNLVVSQAATTLGSVSGTASSGGTATLTATLTSSVTSAGVAGETIDFTLDSVSVGSAVTDSAGVATLTGVATSDAVGTDSGGVVASFVGDSNYMSSQGTGNLVVNS